MSTKLKDLKKNTTKFNDKEIAILETVGLSSEPMSSHKIKIKTNGSGDTIRYIRKLCPLLRKRGHIIFNIDGIKKGINDYYFKLDLIEKIGNIYAEYEDKGINPHIYKLEPHIYESENLKNIKDKYKYSNYNFPDFDDYKKFINDKIKIIYKKNIIIINYEYYKILIEYNEEDNDSKLSILYRIQQARWVYIFKEIVLITKKNKKTELAFYSEDLEGRKSMRYRLLDPSLSEEEENKINSIKNEMRKEDPSLTEDDLNYFVQEIKSIRNATQNWRFSLNLRGLICYLNNININEQQIILRILTNPILLKHAPFLYNCQFFNDFGYPLVRKMIDIAQDYPNVYNSGYYDDEKLEKSIRNRYIDEIKQYYSLNGNNVLLKKDIPQEFKEYFDFMLGNQNNDLKEIIQSNEKILNQLI